MGVSGTTEAIKGRGGGGARQRAVTPALMLIGIIAAIMGSLGAPLIPTIAADSHVSLSTANWLLTVTLLTGALCTPILGKLADGPHQKRVVVAALAVVLLGSVCAAVTDVFAVLLIGRALQGVGLGLLPVTMAIARRHLPAQRVGQVIAWLSVTVAVGVGLGYPVTGLLAQLSDYHVAFWFGALVAASALVVAILVLPSASAGSQDPLDVVGASLLAFVTTAVIIALSEAVRWGWTSAATLGLLVGGVAVGAVWVWWETRHPHPFVDLRLTRNRLVTTANVAGFLISIAMYLFLPIVVEFVQVPSDVGFGFSASVLVAGCALIPLSLGTLVSTRLAVGFQQRFGRRPVIPAGALLFAATMVFFAVEHDALWEAFAATALAGIGIGFTFAAMPSYIVSAVATHETGSAMGFYQVLRSVGLAVGSAVSTAVLAANTPEGSLLPSVDGFRTTLLLGAGLCAVTAVAAIVLPGRSTLAPVSDVLAAENAEIEGSGLPMSDRRLDGPPIQ
jgi:MFS family permease